MVVSVSLPISGAKQRAPVYVIPIQIDADAGLGWQVYVAVLVDANQVPGVNLEFSPGAGCSKNSQLAMPPMMCRFAALVMMDPHECNSQFT
jgi:hypothetical protein